MGRQVVKGRANLGECDSEFNAEEGDQGMDLVCLFSGGCMLELEGLTERVIGAAIEVHRELGPGFLEAVYEEALCVELEMAGLRYERQAPAALQYKGRRLRTKHQMDVMVEGVLIVEIKAVEKVVLVHECQLYSYLRAAEKTVGLLLNFNVPLMKDGIYRRVLTEKSRRFYDA